MHPRTRNICLAIASLLTAGAGQVYGVTFTDLVVFGDSLSDIGNEHAVSGGSVPLSPPYFEGRHSNGPAWIEHLASELGLPAPLASRLGGKNFAYGGAQTGEGISTIKEVPNLGPQITEFLDGGGTIGETDLAVLWAGPNDLQGGIEPSVIVSNLVDHISTLHGNGAQYFLVGNVVGPDELNTMLAEEIERLNTNPSISIATFDWVGLTNEVMSNPAEFGFADVSTPALNLATGEVVPNPDEYAWWDLYYHPTGPLHRIMGERAAEAVAAIPEPSTLVLALVASLALLSSSRGRW